MGFFTFTVTKSTSWRGVTQEFSNRYIYELPTDEPSEVVLEQMLDQLKAAEVPVHATTVNFVGGRCWGPVNAAGRGGTMRVVKSFSGTGNAVALTDMYKELAMLVVWPLGRYGTKNRPQFLRKWLHTHTLFGSSSSVLSGSTKFATTPGPITTYIGAVRTINYGTGGPPLSLASPKGHFADTGGRLYDYLEHRQFG